MRYVPDCPTSPITIYNLLTHTSGIPNLTSFPNYQTIEAEQLTPTQLRPILSTSRLISRGHDVSYSNSGYDVLGYTIKRFSGKSQRTLEKKLRATGYDGQRLRQKSSHDKEFAQGYRYSPSGHDPTRFVNMSVPFGAGALNSTVLDLYRWDQAMDAGKLISKNLMDEMLTGHVAMDEPGGPRYGFGWMISPNSGTR